MNKFISGIFVAVAVILLVASFSSAFWPWKSKGGQEKETPNLAPPTTVAPPNRVLQTCTFSSGSSAGWKICNCPNGYFATGGTGYNCEAPNWDCGSTWGYTTSMAFYHDGVGTAYVSVYCEL